MFSSFTHTQTGPFYLKVCLIICITSISPMMCDDEVKTTQGCTVRNGTCSNKEDTYPYSKEYFKYCMEKLDKYDIKLEPSPFNPKEVCVVFEDLKVEPNESNQLCFMLGKYKSAVQGGVAGLIIIGILDIVGIGIMLYSIIRDCIKPHPKPPPPKSEEAPASTSQPTVVIVQTVGAPAAGNTRGPPVDEESPD